MIVTKVEAVTKTRYRIETDGQPGFELFKGELSRYHLAEGTEISEEVYREIRSEVVGKRAKKKALDLLNIMDRTEADLRQKLLNGGYPADLAEEAIQYVKAFGYIDDSRYVRLYIENRKEKRSKKEICAGLQQKGIKRDMIDAAMEEYYGREDAKEAISTLLGKKRFDPQEADPVQIQKMYAYLARKGFRYDDIRQVIQVYEQNA